MLQSAQEAAGRFATAAPTPAHRVRKQLDLEKKTDLLGGSALYVTQRVMVRTISRARPNRAATGTTGLTFANDEGTNHIVVSVFRPR